ncbi:sulfur transfer protein ThiS [Spiribacter salinus M19-40]|jgi:molybdopterin converting factor small subunit|uniref:Sulfur transfer protein ThiS n=1 Tax=Spiribacter salinus M19-40 TaxID=1260251 RepID=R4VDQ5_9GAMM|nr:MoaD/ThiS family protein [Spiribacter salinus]AGM40456.1 sulfur transfer protein ThiS [Spiribacter salinus M19-40]MBY5269378.1 molybdopterin synthase sulfur carrier subunit [Spiribacter salinus]MDR9413330.1 MoaD/ThiS family protein [Spiribacter sp.]MDR9454415.1 MoaD/ThiS family protein [Spiribacter sp.]
MTQRIELFGVLREAVGASEVSLDLEPPVTVDEVLEHLQATYPGVMPHLPRVACAVGDEMRSRQSVLAQDETLVLLPPVSGG